MAKRKQGSESESCDDDFVEEDSDASLSRRNTIKKPNLKTRQKLSRTKDTGDDGVKAPVSKKRKQEKVPAKDVSATGSSTQSIGLQSSSDSKRYIDLGKKKRVTVSIFKGAPLLDIREYYSAGNEEKPGKKGISLTLEQWETFKKSFSLIDDLFEREK